MKFIFDRIIFGSLILLMSFLQACQKAPAASLPEPAPVTAPVSDPGSDGEAVEILPTENSDTAVVESTPPAVPSPSPSTRETERDLVWESIQLNRRNGYTAEVTVETLTLIKLRVLGGSRDCVRLKISLDGQKARKTRVIQAKANGRCRGALDFGTLISLLRDSGNETPRKVTLRIQPVKERDTKLNLQLTVDRYQ